MAEYTPTTEEIWGSFRIGAQEQSDLELDEAELRAIFDRWLAAHDAEVRAGVVTEEPEWEYGWRDDRPVRWASGTNLPASFPKTVYPYESRPGLTRVRRRKAGPWVPVEQGDET